VGSGGYFNRKLPGPKSVTEIPAPHELLRLIAASLLLALGDAAEGKHALLVHATNFAGTGLDDVCHKAPFYGGLQRILGSLHRETPPTPL
jgi:hypothetical protein